MLQLRRGDASWVEMAAGPKRFSELLQTPAWLREREGAAHTCGKNAKS